MGKEDAEARLLEELRARLADDDPVPDSVIQQAYDALRYRCDGGAAPEPNGPQQRERRTHGDA